MTISIKWERLAGILVLAVLAVFLWRWTVYVESVDAFIDADIRPVYAPIFGQLRMPDIRPGQVFHDGDILFSVHNPRVGSLGIFSEYQDFRQRLRRLEMEIALDGVTLARDIDDHKRMSSLAESGAATAASVRDLRYALDTLRLGIRHKERQAAQIKMSLYEMKKQLGLYEDAQVRMRGEGLVWNVAIKNDDMVKAGDVVAEMIGPKRIWVEAFFHAEDVTSLAAGMPASVKADGLGKEWPAKVAFVRRGMFNKEDAGASSGDVARPHKKGEEYLVAVRLELDDKDAGLDASQFYGYGSRVAVRIRKFLYPR